MRIQLSIPPSLSVAASCIAKRDGLDLVLALGSDEILRLPRFPNCEGHNSFAEEANRNPKKAFLLRGYLT